MTVTETTRSTEPPTELPNGWRWVRLEDLFEVKQGAAMSPVRRQGIAPRPFLRTLNVLWGSVDLSNLDKMDFGENEVRDLTLRSGDLLVCEGGDVGRTAIWRGELDSCLYQNHIHRLRRRQNNVAPEFYAYWMQAAFKVFQSYKGKEITTTIPNLSGGKLKSFMVPFPPTLAEQERIAHILNKQMTAVQQARTATEAQLEAAMALPAAYLNAVFDSVRVQAWPKRTLGEIALSIQNGIYKSAEFYGHGHPFLRMYNIQNDSWRLNTDTIARVELNQHELEMFKVHTGDILVSRVNSFELVGKSAIVEPDVEGYAFENMLIRVRLQDEIDPMFVVQQMNSRRVREQIARVAKRAIGQASINSNDLRGIYLRLPDLAEQNRIAVNTDERDYAARHLCTALKAQLEAVNALPAALLRLAFTGGL